MSYELSAAEVINMLGALVGAMGISISIYFQLISRKYCPPRYVLGFLVFGVLMVMINIGPIIDSASKVIGLKLLAYLLMGSSEIVVAYHIYNKLSVKTPTGALEDFSDEEKVKS